MLEAKLASAGAEYEVTASTAPVHYRVSVLTETVVQRKPVEEYIGPYSAIPKTEPVILNTKDRFLTENITVYKIPCWETSNRSGTTVIIGGE